MSVAVSIPFHLDSTGAIQQTANADKALADRVRALVATVPGERLMRADFGVRTPDALFDPVIRDMVFTQLQQMALLAIRKWEPTAAIVDIQPIVNEEANTVAMDVRVGRSDIPNAELNRSRRVYVTVGGDILDAGR